LNTAEALAVAAEFLQSLSGHVFDVLTVTKPVSPDAAVNLAKVISKLSPLLGNLIEFNSVEFLNEQAEFVDVGRWRRQDPGFPDTILEGRIQPTPGFEIKAWFPLATEITARFKDSQNHFSHDQTNVCMLAWLPEQLIFGKPRIIDVCIVSGRSVAKARDDHYHNPPDYIVLEPEDTKARTRNLQQTNTNGYKFQGSPRQFVEAQRMVSQWGAQGRAYQPTPEYQGLVRTLVNHFPYRLDTNFAKMDRIAHPGIEAFKERVLTTRIHGLTVDEWNALLYGPDDATLRSALETRFDIRDVNAEKLLR
jgi:hypothetical protein